MAVGWWAETFASIAATAQRALASLTGEQPSSGVLAAAAKGASAALVGDQPFTGQVAATAKPAQAALLGGMAPEGVLAVQLRAALFSGVGGSGFEGAISGQAQPALAALIGDQTQQGSIAALLQKASAALVGQQPYAGALAGTAQRATAVLVGDQPFTATLAGQARPAVAALAGGQTQQGALAATARTAAASMSGAADSTPLTITAANAANAQSVALPPHDIGNVIVLFVSTNLTSLPAKPSAGGTVPTWTDIDTSSSGIRTAACVATATNHTTGLWGNAGATDITAVVLSGQAASAIGAHALDSGAASTAPPAPAVNLVKTDGSSVVLHYYSTNALNGANWASAPAGYTRQASTVQNGARSSCLNSKNVTTSDGAVGQGTTVNTAWRCATVEILK